MSSRGIPRRPGARSPPGRPVPGRLVPGRQRWSPGGGGLGSDSGACSPCPGCGPAPSPPSPSLVHFVGPPCSGATEPATGAPRAGRVQAPSLPRPFPGRAEAKQPTAPCPHSQPAGAGAGRPGSLVPLRPGCARSRGRRVPRHLPLHSCRGSPAFHTGSGAGGRA